VAFVVRDRQNVVIVDLRTVWCVVRHAVFIGQVVDDRGIGALGSLVRGPPPLPSARSWAATVLSMIRIGDCRVTITRQYQGTSLDLGMSTTRLRALHPRTHDQLVLTDHLA
jgi:hypothetical protein